jgi:hypothetical protein
MSYYLGVEFLPSSEGVVVIENEGADSKLVSLFPTIGAAYQYIEQTEQGKTRLAKGAMKRKRIHPCGDD